MNVKTFLDIGSSTPNEFKISLLNECNSNLTTIHEQSKSSQCLGYDNGRSKAIPKEWHVN
jgi:hypothetical protein